jgi:hypothetical protein
MSSIGKIFVVVNLVLALLLLGSLGALLNAARSTKADVATLEQQLASKASEFEQAESEYTTRKRDLDGEKRNLESKNQDLEVERDNANNAADKMSTNNQQLRNDVSKLTVSYELLQGDLSAAQQRNTSLQDNNDDLRTNAQESQDGARTAELARRDLEDQITGYESDIANLNGDLTTSMDRARQAERLVDVAKTAGFDPSTLIATPAIDALVAQVDLEYGFVILDKGSVDSVEKGFTFDIYRGPDYLGQVRVDTVNDNYSTARIVLSNGTMRAHDRATTRL